LESFSELERSHWAYQPANPGPIPSNAGADRHRMPAGNPIDAFLNEELARFGFEPAPEATRGELIRRLSLDLTGLPPTPHEVEAFLSDPRPDAYERLVDRLLSSPTHGVRWAQHWLDLAHYADSNGFELDAERPDAWRYRDWVVDAWNGDLPYDRFVALQLAGDEVAEGDVQGLVATGFGRCGPREVVSGNIDPKVRRQSELTEVTGTVGSVFLGLTVGCARCHDHKFDAFPTTDYYRLQAFFAGAEFLERPIASKHEEVNYAAAMKAIDARIAPRRKELAELEAPYRAAIKSMKESTLSAVEREAMATAADKRSPLQKKIAAGLAASLAVRWEDVAEAVAKDPAVQARRESIKRAIHEIERSAPAPPAKAFALAEPDRDAPPTHVLARGEPTSQGVLVEPRPPGVVMALMPAGSFAQDAIRPRAASSGRRAALADWLTRPDHPLTARVIVNRLWHHHFGRGIVATPSDFGVRGEEPSHPVLLDWLATELVRREWSLKSITRLMVNSAAYRRASRKPRDVDASNWDRQEADDGENQLVWRQNARRLEAEAIRDSMLAVSGELCARMKGPGVLPPIEKEIEELIFTEAEVVDLWPKTPDPVEHARRSLYLFRKRNVRYPMFDAFDVPDTQTACPRRESSIHAIQPLVLLNSPFAIDRAKAFAGRLFREQPSDQGARVQRAYMLALGRSPTVAELDQAILFLANEEGTLAGRESSRPLAKPVPEPRGLDPARGAAWVDLCLAMLNRAEFVSMP
jgi:hypothetical protein